MPLDRRHAVLALITVLLSACGSTVAPTLLVTPTGPPETRTALEPTQAPSLTPDCAALEQDGEPRLDIQLRMPTGFGSLSTQVVAARSLSGRAVVLPNQGPPIVRDFGEIQGGINFPGVLMQDGEPIQVRDVSVSGVLAVAGQATPMPMQISLVGSAIAIAFPDIDATVKFGLDLYYRDDCFVYEATARGTALLGSSATVAACPVGDAFVPYTASLARSPISVAGSATRFEITGFEPRWSLGASATDGPPLAEWDRAAPPIAAHPGARMDIVNGNRDLTIDSVSVEIYRRADVVRDDVNAEPIAEAQVVALADGRLDIQAPLEPGRYVVALFSSWTAACAIGEALSVVAVDVT